jgi:peptidyl-prolyl cis-trans isomerase D
MIQQMRKNAATIMWVVIIAFVATIVFAWGMDLSSQSRAKNVVGKINGKELSINYFEKMVESERQKERERSNGAEISPYQNKMLPRQVWETEINRILLKEVFEKMQLTASPDQLYEYIKKNPPREVYSIPQFQTDSMFDTSKYIQFLNDPRAYENEGMRMLEQHTKDIAIPMQTLQALIAAQGEPSVTELAYEYRLENQKAKFEYAKLNAAALSIDSTELSESAINRYYRDHSEMYNSEEQADLYFVKFPKVATTNDLGIIRNDLLDLRKRINNSDSIFQEEAKVESDDEATASHGGDLGWISKGTMVPQFDSVAFSLPLNVVSEPIRTQFGFHLILVEKKEMKDKAMQVKVRHLLRKISPSAETLDRLNAQADSLHKSISSDGIKAAVKKESRIALDSSGIFARGEMVPKIGYLSGVGSFAFNHEVDDVSDIIENEEGYYIFQIKQKLKKGLQPLSVVRQRIVFKLTDSLKLEKANKRFEEDLKKMSDKNDILGLSKIDSLIKTGTTDTVSGARYIPEVGLNNQAVAAAMACKIGVVSPIIKTTDALFLVKPLWQKKIDAVPANDPSLAQIRQKIESQMVQKIYYDWYLDYRNKAKIIDNVNQFYMD